MRRQIVARLAQSLIVVFIVTTISFFVIRLAPGDPFSYESPTHHAGDSRRTGASSSATTSRSLEQYVRYVASVAHGQLGYSFTKHETVADALATTLPRTLLLDGARARAELRARRRRRRAAGGAARRVVRSHRVGRAAVRSTRCPTSGAR